MLAHNAVAAATSHVDDLQPAGSTELALTGRGVLLGEWDIAGVRRTHVDLAGRVLARDASGAADHSTHVAGTLLGAGTADPDARGMAKEATLWSHDWTLDLAEVRASAPYLAVSTHAYSDALGWADNPACPEAPSWLGAAGEAEDRNFGRYGAKAAAIDALVDDTGLLMVWAGGNERLDLGVPSGSDHYHFPQCDVSFDDEHASEIDLEYDTLGGQLSAKNVLVIGAVSPITNDANDPSDIVPLSFSSYGPMDDGRIKPDLVASGAQLLSAVASADDAYERLSGTSSSAAVVGGGVALLTEHVRALLERDLRAEEWRALLVQTARPAFADRRPSYQTGFGLFDARAAADSISEDAELSAGSKHLRSGVLRDAGMREHRTAEVAAGTPLRVTLAWTDPAGDASAAGLDDPTPALVNDLDVVLIAPDGSTAFHAWSLSVDAPEEPATRSGKNHVDNVEVVDVPAAENSWTGRWTVRVELENRPFRLRPQRYALAASAPLSRADEAILGTRRNLLVETSTATNPDPIDLVISNLGTGEVDWNATTSVPWLTLSPAAGTATDELGLAFDIGSLDAGEHLGIVSIDAGEAGRATIGVVLRVRCAQDCSGLECGPDPQCGEPCGACPFGQACDASGACVALITACPGVDLGSGTGLSVAAGATDLAGDDDGGSCGGTGADDVAFTWTPPGSGLYRLSTEGSELDTVLYLRDACGGTELACNDDTEDQTSSVTVSLDGGVPVQVIVDGKAGSGAFRLHIARALCPQADLGARIGAAIYEGNLRDVDDTWPQGCGGENDRDVTFLWTAPASDSYRFAAEGASSLALRTSCRGAEVDCDASAEPTASADLEAGESVAIFVELSPPYDLRLHVSADSGLCAGSCDGSPNAGSCWCDAACVELGDCCDDACAVCGSCCVPQCDGKACGADACGGSCGSCGDHERCDEGSCIADPCVGEPDGSECDDGNACTRGDECLGERCAGRPVLCPDGQGCEAATGRCVPRTACSADAGCAADASCPTTSDDAAVCPIVDTGDASHPEGGPQTGAHDGGASRGNQSDGCSCRLAGPGVFRSARLPWVLVLAITALRRRKRRARRAATQSDRK